MTIADTLVEHLKRVADSFAEGELAYLALTSKSELAFRDRLAWTLHSSHPEWIVAREWKRIDLAILPSDPVSAPIALVQTKAIYFFDAADPRPGYNFQDLIKKDFEKAEKHSDQSSELYSLVFVTDPGEGPEQQWDGIVKYGRQVRDAVTKHGSAAAIRDLGRHNLAHHLAEMGPVRSRQFGNGSAFEVDVAVDWWLTGPRPD